MENSSELKKCPKCQTSISAEAPEGLCPACLLAEVSNPTEGGQKSAAGAQAPDLTELAAAFPQLEILEMIGRGGMGFVFKARQPKLDRFVALKILPANLAADPAFAERFSQEGRVLARLNHPNIVTIHDFGLANGFFYLVMEYVDGVNLREAMKIGRFTPEQALAIVPRICDALEFAHGEGILHRDIKPENILLDSKGRVKIADFGIAKIVGTESRPEAPNTEVEQNATRVIGTPQYMAPEQLESRRNIDQRADIYSLGVVFYEMLTGELPLGRFAPPSKRATVDPRLDEVVLRALEKEPERRTSSAGEVKTQVETISGTIQSPPLPRENAATTPEVFDRFRYHFGRGLRAGAWCFLVVELLVVISSFILPNTYLANARIALHLNDQELADTRRLEAEMEKMQSDKALLEVARSAHLAERWGRRYGNGAPWDDSAVLNFLKRSLQLVNSPRTSLIEIRVYSDSPTEAAELANGLADVYCRVTTGAFASIVNSATVPDSPIRPNRPMNIAVGALAATLSAALVGLLVTLFSFTTPRPRTASGSRSGYPIAPNHSPLSLVLVGLLLIVSGTAATWSVVADLPSHRYSFNLGALLLPAGIGLLRCRPWWRRFALAYLGVFFVFLVVSFPLLSRDGYPASVKLGFMNETYSLSHPRTLFVLAMALVLILLPIVVLLRGNVKRQFGRRGFHRPWIEWVVLLGAFAISFFLQHLWRISSRTPDLARADAITESRTTVGYDFPAGRPERAQSAQTNENTLAHRESQLAEQELREAEAKYQVGAIDTLTLEKARAAREIAQAKMEGDFVAIARANLRVAELTLDVAKKKLAVGAASQLEYSRAELARDIAADDLRTAQATDAKTTKTIELTKVTPTVGNQIAAWSESLLPPGENVTSVMRLPDGRMQEGNTQRMTIRQPAGSRVTTVFYWKIPDTFSFDAWQAARTALESNYVGRPLTLRDDEPEMLLMLTNRAGGIMTLGLEYKKALNLREPASVRFTSATNVSRMVLGYFGSTLPPGGVLEAGAVAPNGAEAEVHTSISKGPGFDNGTVRWDIPSGFTREEMQAAAERVSHRTLKVEPGERVRAFTATNSAGQVYEAFFELFAPASQSGSRR